MKEFAGIVHPQQLEMLTEALERYCQTADIQAGTNRYEAAGRRIIALFQGGAHTVDEILAGLNGKQPVP